MSWGSTTYQNPIEPFQETGLGMGLLYAGAGGLLAAMFARGSKKARAQTIAAGTAAGGVLAVLMRPTEGRKRWFSESKSIRGKDLPHIRTGPELEAAGWGALERGRVRVRGVEFRPHEVQGWGRYRHVHWYTPRGGVVSKPTGTDVMAGWGDMAYDIEPIGLDGWGRHDHYFNVAGGAPYRRTGPNMSIAGYGAGEAPMIASAARRGLEWPLSAPKVPRHTIQKIVVTLGAYLLVMSLWKAGSRRRR